MPKSGEFEAAISGDCSCSRSSSEFCELRQFCSSGGHGTIAEVAVAVQQES